MVALVSSLRPPKERFAGKADPQSLVASWEGDESLDGRPARFLTGVLTTPGCILAMSGGCSFCGYYNDTAMRVSPEQLRTQFGSLLARRTDQRILKVYTSGSFFDPREVTPEIQVDLLRSAVDAGFSRIVVESLPAFLTAPRLAAAAAVAPQLEIAIGLESAHPMVLEYAMNKGFSRRGFLAAALRVQAAGLRVRAYLLMKPAFLTEWQAIEDVVATAAVAAPLAHTISINPLNVQKATLNDRLFQRGVYRPPWLWSVIAALQRIATAHPTVHLLSSPTAGGTPRGTHNCGRCDAAALATLRQACVTQDFALLSQLHCPCQQLWAQWLVQERYGLGAGGLAPLERHLRALAQA